MTPMSLFLNLALSRTITTDDNHFLLQENHENTVLLILQIFGKSIYWQKQRHQVNNN
jgi:hypothetical protein